MSERLTPQQFHDADGVEDWRVVTNVAQAHFRTGSFAVGVALVNAIGTLADAAGHLPEVDLRPEGVTVRLTTRTPEHFFWLSERDVEMAQRISVAAHELGVPADPAAVQIVQVTIDALVHPDVMPFWHAVLGYREVGDEDLLDPRAEGPAVWFQQMDAPRTGRNRIHIDVWVPHDQGEARVAAAIAAGGPPRVRRGRAGVVDAGRRRGQRGGRRHLDGPRLTSFL
jgi:4a-hydroxytetrahydrobiopterin dehydratase